MKTLFSAKRGNEYGIPLSVLNFHKTFGFDGALEVEKPVLALSP